MSLISTTKLLLVASVLSVILPVSPQKFVCYFGSWSNYRNGDGKFIVEDIDPFICTHLVYGFAKLGSDNRIASYDPYLDLKENWGLGAYERFTGLKHTNPDLKTILAIGGWNEGSVKYSNMASSPATREVFVSSCVDFLLRYGFDGLDMDWEYPANRGGTPTDKANFVLLLKELHEAFKAHGLTVSAAVSAGKPTIETAYDIPQISQYLDFINLMTYDFHGSWDPVTGHNTPLYPRPNDSETNKMFTVDYAANFWINSGAPREKIILGMALYGRTFTLKDSAENGIGAPVTGAGQAGPFTNEAGLLGFNEICNMINKDNSWTVVFDEYYKSPYAFKGNQWVSYDDIESISIKVDYIKEMKLGGGMVWSIETDDFKGRCEGMLYPLMSTIHRGLQIPDTGHTSRPTISTTTTKLTTTKKLTTSKRPTITTSTTLRPEVSCTREGYFRIPNDCQKFYFCLPLPSGGYHAYTYTCPLGTMFSEKEQTCDFPVNVPECENA